MVKVSLNGSCPVGMLDIHGVAEPCRRNGDAGYIAVLYGMGRIADLAAYAEVKTLMEMVAAKFAVSTCK